jgi:hypothetical protein
MWKGGGLLDMALVLMKQIEENLEFQPRIDIKHYRKYARIEIDLWRTAYHLSRKGVRKINGFLARYTIARSVLGKPYGATPDVVTAYVHREDLNEVMRKLLRMVRRYSQPVRRLGG